MQNDTNKKKGMDEIIMKKFKFTVKKILENDIEIKAKDKKEAVKSIVKFLSIGEEFIFKNTDKNRQIYEIKLKEIEQKEAKDEVDNDIKIQKMLEEINTFFVENDKENDEHFEEDSVTEYKEIVCEKCGNCIPLDEIL